MPSSIFYRKIRGAMAGITQKSVVLFPLWFLKNIILFLFLRESGRTDVNQQKLTKKSKFKFDKKSCQYYDNCNSNYYLIDNKYKNSIIIIEITKNDYHNNNNSNNTIIIMIIIKLLIIVIIFRTIKTTSIIIKMIIITDHYSKLTRSSYGYCLPRCSFFEKILFNSAFARVDMVCCF